MLSPNLLIYSLVLGCLCVLLILAPTAYTILEKSSVFIFVLYAAFFISRRVKRTFFNKKLLPDNKAILITGCDSGFGHTLVKRMDQLGYRVFACCFFPEGEGALNLKQICSSNVAVLPLDVTNDKSVQEAKKFVEENLGNHVLWAVVNNAGIPQFGEIDWAPIDEIQRVHEVNTFGTVRVTKTFLPLLKKSKGRIVNNTSSVGRYYCPGNVAYCMSKSAAIAFTEGLRIELFKWDIKTISIEPFFYKTSLITKESVIAGMKKMWDKADLETRQSYGEAYIESFTDIFAKTTDNILSTKIYQVINCFEEAITTEDPQNTYFPSYLPHKLWILVCRYLPSSFKENYQKQFLELIKTPATLICSRENAQVKN